MHKIIQLIYKFLYNKNFPSSMKVHVHWMNLMKNQMKQTFQNFEGKGCMVEDSFLKPFDKTLCSMGSKCLTLNS